MFTCINCTKQTSQEREEEEEAHEIGTPRTRDPIRTLTTQIKDMAIKVSGSYRHFRPCAGSSSTSEEIQYPYMAGVSSSPTPGWDLGSSSNNPGAESFETRFLGGVGGDQTPGANEPSSISEIVEEDLDQTESNEWMALVEPGVHITLVPLPDGGNELRRIRFSREIFSRWEAQRWWVESYDKIIELYNIKRITRQELNLPPTTTEDEPREAIPPPLASARRSPMSSSFKEWARQGFLNELALESEGCNDPSEPIDLSAGLQFQTGSSSTTASKGKAPVTNEAEMDAEWIEQDEPGVFVTVRQLEDGSKELRRIRFSRQMFGEEEAKNWWEKNRERVHAQYL